jgi:hypothetical protein
LLSLAAARFTIVTVLNHTFPNWRQLFSRRWGLRNRET